MNRIIEQELFKAVGDFLTAQTPRHFDAMETAYHKQAAANKSISADKDERK